MNGKLYRSLAMFSMLSIISSENSEYPMESPFADNKKELKDLDPIKLNEPILHIGNGKHKFIYKTNLGDAEIFADTQKAADKKKGQLIGVNWSIGFHLKFINDGE